MDGAAGVKALGAAAQYHRIARLHAKPCSISRDVGPAFVNDPDDAKGHGNPLDHQPVGPLPLRHDAAQGIRQPGDRVKPGGHCLDAAFVEHEAVEHRVTESSFTPFAHVDRVCFEYLAAS